MELFLTSLLYLFTLGIILCIWALICNNRTYHQRSKLLEDMEKQNYDQFWYQMAIYQSVSYDKHFWTLIRFGNPNRLYKIK